VDPGVSAREFSRPLWHPAPQTVSVRVWRLYHDTGLHGRAIRCPKGTSVPFAHRGLSLRRRPIVLASGKVDDDPWYFHMVNASGQIAQAPAADRRDP